MPDLANVTAVILAGGLGTRLRSSVADRPKVLAEVRGRPFLAFVLDQLAEAGLTYVVLCTGYLGEKVQSEFGDTYGPLQLAYSQESSLLGTAGALRLALDLIKSDLVLVMNGDSFCEADLSTFSSWHWIQDAEVTLLLTEVPDVTPYGRVRVDSDRRVLGFDEKDGTGGAGWINAGIYLLDRRLLQTIPTGRAVSLEREMFPTWIGRGMYGYQSQGRFLDIGTPERFARAERFFALER